MNQKLNAILIVLSIVAMFYYSPLCAVLSFMGWVAFRLYRGKQEKKENIARMVANMHNRKVKTVYVIG